MSVSFTSLGVPARLATILSGQGIDTAFPIQEATLPSTLEGKDVLGRGRTGSGKTLAFSLPLVARLAANPKPRKARFPRALIMAPTRELATQISRVVIPLAEGADLRTTVIFGGVSQVRQEKELNSGVDIVIACPGRLEDLLRQKVVDLSRVEVSVLDEADHMADLGFLPVVKRILDQTPRGIQHMLFSATLDNGVDKLVQRYLDQPVVHSVDSSQAAVDTMDHHVFVVDADSKKELVLELASGTGRRIMFMRTKHHAKKMAVWLSKAGVPAVDLHGNLSQNARDRNLAAFSGGDARVLVATDVAARGVHVDGVELVVHIDPPAEHKAYLHRSGRTARAGSAGAVATIATPDQQGDVKSLMRAAGIKVPFEKVSPQSAAVAAVRGDKAEPVTYVAPRPQSNPRAKTLADSDAAGGRGRRRGGRGNSRPGRPAARGEGSAAGVDSRGGRDGGERSRDDRPRGERGGRPGPVRGERNGERAGGRNGGQRAGSQRSGGGRSRSGQRQGSGRPEGRDANTSRPSSSPRPTSSGARQGSTIGDAIGQKTQEALGAGRPGRGRGSRRAGAPQSNSKG
ncbi:MULTISPECIES: DEAD/DEAH box helicase [unclassified Arthrobacter]|uniref:DEAD/DEAH box helicase n=1 Tax=unclassified Arthrobacter TaxID=235627 RepID=UPI0040334D34